MTTATLRTGAVTLLVVFVAFAAGRVSHGFKLTRSERGTWSLSGYHFDDRLEDVGRSFSCSLDTLYGFWENRCFAGDGLDLCFYEDGALEYMIYEVPVNAFADETNPRQLWL